MLTEILNEFVFKRGPDELGTTILMPSLEYAFSAWLLRLVGIAIACYLWYLSIKLFKKNRWIIPGMINFLAYFLLFMACFETNVIVYQCENMSCPHVSEKIYYGIIGLCIYKTEESVYPCICKDTERQLWKAVEMRFWGGFIGALPLRSEYIHKLSSSCPFCGR